ncbi:MAG: DMT family transporter [Alphaproteobacteria bacterium]|nr:DMT family transporter [Alphaproteobacteria bacterium]
MAPLAAWQAATWQGRAGVCDQTRRARLDRDGAAWRPVHGVRLSIYFRLLREAGATNASLVTLLVPVTATAIGAGFLGEALSGVQFAGMAILLAGLCVLDGRVFKLFAPRDRPVSKPTGEGR